MIGNNPCNLGTMYGKDYFGYGGAPPKGNLGTMYGKDYFGYGGAPPKGGELDEQLKKWKAEAKAIEKILYKEGDPEPDAQMKEVFLLMAKVTFDQLVASVEDNYNKYSTDDPTVFTKGLKTAKEQANGDKAAYMSLIDDVPNAAAWVELLKELSAPVVPPDDKKKADNTWMWLVGGAIMLYYMNKK